MRGSLIITSFFYLFFWQGLVTGLRLKHDFGKTKNHSEKQNSPQLKPYRSLRALSPPSSPVSFLSERQKPDSEVSEHIEGLPSDEKSDILTVLPESVSSEEPTTSNTEIEETPSVLDEIESSEASTKSNTESEETPSELDEIESSEASTRSNTESEETPSELDEINSSELTTPSTEPDKTSELHDIKVAFSPESKDSTEIFDVTSSRKSDEEASLGNGTERVFPDEAAQADNGEHESEIPEITLVPLPTPPNKEENADSNEPGEDINSTSASSTEMDSSESRTAALTDAVDSVKKMMSKTMLGLVFIDKLAKKSNSLRSRIVDDIADLAETSEEELENANMLKKLKNFQGEMLEDEIASLTNTVVTAAGNASPETLLKALKTLSDGGSHPTIKRSIFRMVQIVLFIYFLPAALQFW